MDKRGCSCKIASCRKMLFFFQRVAISLTLYPLLQRAVSLGNGAICKCVGVAELVWVLGWEAMHVNEFTNG